MRAFLLTLMLTASVAQAEPSDAPPWLQELLWGTKRWEDGTPRLFFAEQLDVGYVYVRARSFFGYGRPHDLWGGLEVTPLFNMGGVGGFIGLAGSLRFVNLRVGARPMLSLQKPYLPAVDSHQRVEFMAPGHSAKYVTLEAELSGEWRLGPTRLALLTSISSIRGNPVGTHIYEETLRIVAPDGAWIWRARAEYALFVIPGMEHNIGLAFDALGVPTRGEVQLRAGIVARVVLSPFLEARLSLVPMVYARKDRVGLITSDFTELGLRWRFATGQ